MIPKVTTLTTFAGCSLRRFLDLSGAPVHSKRMQRLEEQPRGAPNLTGPAEIRAAAEAVALEYEAEQQEMDAEAQELGIPVDPIGVDAYIINLHRRCLGGPYKEGTVRSQRDLFGYCWTDLLACPTSCLARQDLHQLLGDVNNRSLLRQDRCW